MNRKEGHNDFNIYYMNFSKVYEIAMMINNQIVKSYQREKGQQIEDTYSLDSLIEAKGDVNFLTSIKSSMTSKFAEKITTNAKVIESIEVQTTKSILLRQITGHCNVVKGFSELQEGDLIKIDQVKMDLLDEESLRQFLILKRDALKGLRVEGMDLNNMINSMLQDYAYILVGTIKGIEDKLVLKIPMEAKAEFENKYNIDDILIGHVSVKNFKRLFSAGETPIYSVFLFGKSGIGKTEVARVLNAALAKENTLAKINFQNYSSQDALNSLIGSPAGYIGCEHGELSEKISKSKVGVLLCDEFEKTTRPVYSFFLELLEEGKFTDSLAREYDMKGYVVIFTSNILNETEYKKIIPQELQTRFDLVCEFEAPSRNDKKEFIELLSKRAEEKYPEFEKLLEADIAKLKNMNNYPYESLREIKKAFNNLLMECFSQYDESMS